MSFPKRTISIDPAANALLERVSNASGYISQTVLDRWQTWQSALQYLTAQGWRAPELLAACDVLRGHRALGPYSRSATRIAACMAMGRLTEKHDVQPNRWQECTTRIRSSEMEALALSDLVSEFWSGNQACEAAIRLAE